MDSLYSEFMTALRDRNFSYAKRLIAKGYNINHKDKDGETALYCCAIVGRYDIVQFLINNAADINICNNQQCSPVFVASQEGHGKVVKLLIDSGTDMNKLDARGCSPLLVVSKTINSCVYVIRAKFMARLIIVILSFTNILS